MLPALTDGIGETLPNESGRAIQRAASAVARNFKSRSGELQDALRMLLVRIDAGFHLVDDRFVDNQLPVVADVDLESIHRARRRSFEVESADVIAGAVARALKLLLRLQPSRRASEMRALGEDRVEAGLGANDPGAKILLEFFADFANDVVVGEAGLELRRRQEEHARKCRAHGGQQADQREYAEAGPSEHAEKIATAPQRAELGFFLVTLRAFFCLLVLAPLLQFGGIGRGLLFECNCHLSDVTSQLETSCISSSTPDWTYPISKNSITQRYATFKGEDNPRSLREIAGVAARREYLVKGRLTARRRRYRRLGGRRRRPYHSCIGSDGPARRRPILRCRRCGLVHRVVGNDWNRRRRRRIAAAYRPVYRRYRTIIRQ